MNEQSHNQSCNHSHRRYNPLSGKWVLVSPQRLSRPWQGEIGEAESQPPSYDPECYLCPGNDRVTGYKNPDYEGVYVFQNDFSALQQQSDMPTYSDALFTNEAVTGECRVICFSPDHGKSMPELSHGQVENIVAAWMRESEDLGVRFPCVQIFENKGAMMGCSNPHPHGQIWATSCISGEVQTEEINQQHYFIEHERPLLLDLSHREAEAEERIVVRNEHWLAIVPYWASWPFEILLLPRFAVQQITQLNTSQQSDLALTLRQLTARYDNLFQCSFPYSMGWHGAPFGQENKAHWQLHAHFYPPLLRSATVRKFMVGYEMMAEAQRDLTPEKAAEMLRAVPDIHFRMAK